MKFKKRMSRFLTGGLNAIGGARLDHVSRVQASFYSVAAKLVTIKNKVVVGIKNKLKSREELAAIKEVMVEDEAMRILKEVEVTIRDVEGSKFYRKLHKLLSKSKDIKRNLKRVLGSHSHLQMVFYAIGSLEFNHRSHYQLAIAILLRQDFSGWIGGKIEVYDPCMSDADVIVLEKLGLEVLSINENCRRRVEKPTLFFMPYPDYDLLGNLFEANWFPSQINQTILFARKLSDNMTSFFTTVQYLKGIQNFTKEIAIKANYGDIIENFALHFFDVDLEIDLDDCLLSDIVREERKNLKWEHEEHKPNEYYKHYNKHSRIIFLQPFKKDDEDDTEWFSYYGEYRGPNKYRRVWRPPPSGWVKLNFSGKGCDEHSPAGYGGIFHCNKKGPLAFYSGSLGDVDATVANVEALRHGLRYLKSMSPPVKKLVVEGNDLSVIRWTNRCPQPPVRIKEALLEISCLLKDIKCVIYHIYEDANVPSIILAEMGATLDTTLLWKSTSNVCLKDKASLPKGVEDPEFKSPLKSMFKIYSDNYSTCA